VSLTPVPVGGCALLAFYGADSGNFAPPSGVTNMTLSRSVNGGAFVQLYSGAPVPYWCDVGDGPSASSAPLSASLPCTWQATDSGGTTTVGPVTLGSAIVTVPDGLTQLLIRLLQASADNAPRSSGAQVQPVQVTTRMPQGGWQAMPFIVVNLELFQQSDTAVGQDVLNPNAVNLWTLPGWSRRVWRVSVMSQDADERDFYRDTLMIAFRVLKATLFGQVGQNIRHDFQANSGTTADEWIGQGPGLYWADLMLTLEGTFDVTVATGYNLIERFDASLESSASGSAPFVVDTALVPP
jgi:hypothetical protein